tara:strand:+ start:153 stop:1028 length:876 start_codon:yes stop_codon:yes gene_type:complete
MRKFNLGIVLGGMGSFWWGIVGVIYFKSLSYIGHFELVIHRCIWTTIFLFFTTICLSKWDNLTKIFKSKKLILVLLVSSFLILTNWSVWIYAISSNQIINASFGYFIMPIISVMFGFIFFKERLSLKSKISILLVILSIIFLLYNFKNIPWVGIVVAISWSLYNVFRKIIKVDTDLGLFVESIYIFPFAILSFFLISINGEVSFTTDDPSLMLLLSLAGPITVIPLFLYIKGVELSGLGPSGMIFYITPTLQFLLGFFYYEEIFSFEKFISFIIIWIAVVIYLKDVYEKNK